MLHISCAFHCTSVLCCTYLVRYTEHDYYVTHILCVTLSSILCCTYLVPYFVQVYYVTHILRVILYKYIMLHISCALHCQVYYVAHILCVYNVTSILCYTHLVRYIVYYVTHIFSDTLFKYIMSHIS